MNLTQTVYLGHPHAGQHEIRLFALENLKPLLTVDRHLDEVAQIREASLLSSAFLEQLPDECAQFLKVTDLLEL